MFGFRDTVAGSVRVQVAFTDSTLDLSESGPALAGALSDLEEACGTRFLRLQQVHGVQVCVVDPARGPARAEQAPPTGDALVARGPGAGLMVRVADCVPVLLADSTSGVIAAVHAGRLGVVQGVTTAAVAAMRELGATRFEAWVGPHVCGGCYEVPEAMRAEVSRVVPQAWAQTRWGTPGLDLGAGVVEQLGAAGVEVHRAPGCTLEEPGLHSFRRDGAAAGRFAGLVWVA